MYYFYFLFLDANESRTASLVLVPIYELSWIFLISCTSSHKYSKRLILIPDKLLHGLVIRVYSGVKNLLFASSQSFKKSCLFLMQWSHPQGRPSLHFSHSVQFDNGLNFSVGHLDNLKFCPLRLLSISITFEGANRDGLCENGEAPIKHGLSDSP